MSSIIKTSMLSLGFAVAVSLSAYSQTDSVAKKHIEDSDRVASAAPVPPVPPVPPAAPVAPVPPVPSVTPAVPSVAPVAPVPPVPPVPPVAPTVDKRIGYIIDDLVNKRIVENDLELSFSLDNTALVVNGKTEPAEVFVFFQKKYIKHSRDHFNYIHKGGSITINVMTDDDKK